MKKLICSGVDEQGCGKTAERVRQNTSYAKEEDNWIIACPDCLDIINAEWDEMWKELYADILQGIRDSENSS